MVISLVPTAEGGTIQIHKRPARQQVRCALFTQTRSLGQRFLCLCLSLSLSIYQVLWVVQWLVIHMRAGGAVLRSLDGEGVFKFFHARLQILDFSLLCFQEEVFDPVEPFRYLCIECLDLLVQCLHILLAGHVGISHRRKLFNCGW